MNDGRQLDLDAFADQAPVVLRREPFLRVLITGQNRSYLLEVEDWRNLTSTREVLAPDPLHDYDNGDARIAGVHRTPDGRIVAMYHAEDHVGLPRFLSGQPGHYASVVLDGVETLTGWLLYGHSPSWGHWFWGGTPHHLAGHLIRFDKGRFPRRVVGRYAPEGR